jgi:hypothetical protein
MAITLATLETATRGFARNGVSADFSGTEELVAAVAGKSHYLTQLEISCVAAITVTIGEGETGGAVTTVLFGPFNFAAGSGSPISLQFNPAIKLTAATSLTIDASGAGAVQVFVQGYTE